MFVNFHHDDNMMAVWFLGWIPVHPNAEAENVFEMLRMTTRTFINSVSNRAE